ncbi:MAG: SRPBCC domain-containing protein [Flavipsychrobacter sp.]|nr:SRPBCC domain-containing protein [Flavipsychrobacter sp.]
MPEKNYKAANYTVEIEVAKSPKDVFEHVIDLSKWWPEEFEGERIKPGTEFVFKTGNGHYSKNKVVEFVPNNKVVWITTESVRKTDNYDWTGTKFIFELIPHGNNTALRFTYDGVVLEHEADKLAEICEMTIKELFYNYVTAKKDFTATIELDRFTQEVFKAITEDVAKWWGGKDLIGNSTKLNDEFVIRHPGAHYSKQKLIEIIPDRKVVWLVTESELSWLQKDKHEWTNTKIVFEITTKGDKTVLHFTHEGLVPGKECYETCTNRGWDIVIKNYLFNFITDGKAAFI